MFFKREKCRFKFHFVAKAEVIVNSTASDLSLNCGTVSKLIYERAGVEILDECKQNHPNGIKPGEIAITSAGKFDYVKYLFHVNCLPYSNLVDSGRVSILAINCWVWLFP